MKNFKIWSLVALLALALVGCKDKSGADDDPTPTPTPTPSTDGLAKDIVNQWRIVSFDGENTEYFDIYIDFNEDGSFEMYQRLYTLNYELYTGTYSVSNDILTGSYADGENWTCAYKGAVASDGSNLTLHSQEDVSITSVYARTVIPEEVKAEATETRAASGERFL